MIFHCTKCDHEWQAVEKTDNICSWCKADGYEITAKEQMKAEIDKFVKEHGSDKFFKLLEQFEENLSSGVFTD